MSGSRVVVVGGTSGIGREVARQAAGFDTATLDAHDDGAIEAFFRTVGPVDHLVSLVGDSMSGGFPARRPRRAHWRPASPRRCRCAA